MKYVYASVRSIAASRLPGFLVCIAGVLWAAPESLIAIPGRDPLRVTNHFPRPIMAIPCPDRDRRSLPNRHNPSGTPWHLAEEWASQPHENGTRKRAVNLSAIFASYAISGLLAVRFHLMFDLEMVELSPYRA